jgi:hypothetical protein
MSEAAEVFDKTERIGVIGSPSSTSRLTIDLLGTAVDKRLVGTLCVFKFNQDGKDHYALGQVTGINLRNIWIEDPTMRGLIRQKGRVDPVTEKQDTHTASMIVSAVFSRGIVTQASVLGTVPSTGTSVRLMNEELMDSLLTDYRDEIFYLGRGYGTTIRLPLWLKHFGKEKAGAGEAYHIGIFGKTGSGKSVLAKMMMIGYSLHPEMSLVILDPQGEFSKLKRDTEILDILRRNERNVNFYDLHNLVLQTDNRTFSLFFRILRTTEFFYTLAIFHEDNQARAELQMRRILCIARTLPDGTSLPPKPWELWKRSVFDYVWQNLGTEQVQKNIYTSIEIRERMIQQYLSLNPDDVYQIWSRVARLFAYEGKTNTIMPKDLGKGIAEKGRIAIIDLSETEVPANIHWNEKVRMIVINQLLSELSKAAEARFKEGKLLNTLVIIDEAHRLAPRYQRRQVTETEEDPELMDVKRTLVDASRTTRKYGLGWMFISQSLSGLDIEILRQLRIYILGFGLGWGLEFLALRDIVGGNEEAIKLYQQFKDPQSTLGEREYSFMTWGPISPLSFSGTPLFFTALDYPTGFLRANTLRQPS